MRVLAVLGLATLLIPSAMADDDLRPGPATEKTAVYMQAGYSSGASRMDGAALGGVLVRDLTSRLSLEASAAWLGQGMGSNGLSATASLLVNLRPASEKAVPYLAIGGGLYRASFDMGHDRFRNGMGPGDTAWHGPGMPGPGPGMVGWGPGSTPGSGWGPGNGPWNQDQMPRFYADRFGDRDGAFDRDRSFTDPAIGLGGGIRVDLGSRLYLRPDARALIVTSSGDTRTVGVFAIDFGYRF